MKRVRVYVRNYRRDVSGKVFLGKWEKLEGEEKVVKWYCRRLVRNGEIGEFIGFGVYGCVSVEGWIWCSSSRYRGVVVE